MNYLELMKKNGKVLGGTQLFVMDIILNYCKKHLIKNQKQKPTAIIAKTVKGKGVKFMENNNDWHHGRLTQDLYEQAIKFLN